MKYDANYTMKNGNTLKSGVTIRLSSQKSVKLNTSPLQEQSLCLLLYICNDPGSSN